MSNLFKNLLSKAHTIKNGINALSSFRGNGVLLNKVGSGLNGFNYKHSVAYEVKNPKEKEILSKEIINKVNEQVANNNEGRLFAIIHVAGKQFKITEGDVIVVEGYWPPDIGDKLNFEKIMIAAGSDFSLIGTPLIERGLMKVTGTVIEKTLSHTKTHFRKKRRKQYKRINFYRVQQTMVRINDVKIVGTLNNPPEVVQGPVTTM
nr:39S ribosomal protein L21, mitochondrial [Onthophagus taurus]